MERIGVTMPELDRRAGPLFHSRLPFGFCFCLRSVHHMHIITQRTYVSPMGGGAPVRIRTGAGVGGRSARRWALPIRRRAVEGGGRVAHGDTDQAEAGCRWGEDRGAAGGLAWLGWAGRAFRFDASATVTAEHSSSSVVA